MVKWRDERRGAENLVRELPEGEERRCWVALPGSSERCPNMAVIGVYGIPFCEVHGEEAKEGALEELYFDATQEVERPLNGAVRDLNPEAERALEAARRELYVLLHAAEQTEQVLTRAFPLIRERVDSETLAYVADPDSPEARNYSPPYDAFRAERHHIHRLMRLAFEEGYDWLVEVLEPSREKAAEQAAYALVLEEEAGVRTVLR